MKVAAIIPAYNEEATVGKVVKCARTHKLIDEVILVNDGSFDDTAEISRLNGAKVIDLKENLGKGKALDKGIKQTSAKIILLLDADLVGFTHNHINMLLEPVVRGEADMAVGAVDKSGISPVFNKHFAKKQSPISGIRALKKDFWHTVPGKYKKKFYTESAINYFAKKQELRIKPLVLKGANHLTKEVKLGPWEGTKARWKMSWQVVFINMALRLNRLWILLSKKLKKG